MHQRAYEARGHVADRTQRKPSGIEAERAKRAYLDAPPPAAHQYLRRLTEDEVMEYAHPYALQPLPSSDSSARLPRQHLPGVCEGHGDVDSQLFVHIAKIAVVRLVSV